MARHEANAPLGKSCSLLIGRELKPSRRASCKEICGRRGAADRIGSKSRSGNHRNSEGSDPDKEIRGVRCEGTLRSKGGSEEVTAYRRDRPECFDELFLEVFVPQGSTGHVCGAGYDEHDKLVLFGAYSGNPLTFRGEGEVTFSQVSVTLVPVSNRPGGGKTSGR